MHTVPSGRFSSTPWPSTLPFNLAQLCVFGGYCTVVLMWSQFSSLSMGSRNWWQVWWQVSPTPDYGVRPGSDLGLP